MRIGDEVYVHGYVDEIRKDVIIIRNNGGYFGTVPSEMFYYEEDKNGYGTMNSADTPQTETADRIPYDPLAEMDIKRMVEADEYELPLVVADTAKELAEICGTTKHNVETFVCKRSSGRIRGTKYIKVANDG